MKGQVFTFKWVQTNMKPAFNHCSDSPCFPWCESVEKLHRKKKKKKPFTREFGLKLKSRTVLVRDQRLCQCWRFVFKVNAKPDNNRVTHIVCVCVLCLLPWRLQVAVQDGGNEGAADHGGEAPPARAARTRFRHGQDPAPSTPPPTGQRCFVLQEPL